MYRRREERTYDVQISSGSTERERTLDQLSRLSLLLASFLASFKVNSRVSLHILATRHPLRVRRSFLRVHRELGLQRGKTSTRAELEGGREGEDRAS